jgi:predicted chitinase
MYLATLLHESDGLRVTEEYHNSASISEYSNKYIGRGYIQLSSIENYRAASKYFKEDYVENPEKVKNDPHAWNVSAWYWQDQVHQHVKHGFRAVVKDGIRPLQPHWERREKIYGNVCKAFNVS